MTVILGGAILSLFGEGIPHVAATSTDTWRCLAVLCPSRTSAYGHGSGMHRDTSRLDERTVDSGAQRFPLFEHAA